MILINFISAHYTFYGSSKTLEYMFNSEILPRRNSLQFVSVKKKKTEIVTKWVNLEKKSHKIKNLWLYSYHSQDELTLSSGIQIPIPHQFRIKKKKIALVLSNINTKNKKRINKFLHYDSIGKITMSDNLAQKNKFDNYNFLNSEFLLLDNSIAKIQLSHLSRIFKKKKIQFSPTNLKNKISFEIVKKLSCYNITYKKSKDLSILLSKKICPKSLHFNITNTVGALIEKLNKNKNKILRVSIKTQLLPMIDLYLKKQFSKF